MNNNIKNILFFFIVFCSIFNNFYSIHPMKLFAGILSDKLVFYPLFLGMIYTCYLQYKSRDSFIQLDKFKKFLSLYTIFT